MPDSDITEATEPFDPTKIKLTERQAECLTFCEQIYWIEQALPTADRIAEVFGITKQTARKWLDSPEFDYILTSKGVKFKGTKGVLTAPQMMIVNMLLNLGDRRSEREKCEASGITPQQLSAWRRDKQFIGYMQNRAEQMFKDSDDIAYLNVMRNMQGGDLSAAKFYFEMTGKYQPSLKLDVNVDMILARVIEILQVRVKDPNVLEAIASDFDGLMTRGSFDTSFVTEQSAIEAHVAAPVSNPLDLPSFGGVPDVDLGV